MKNLFCILSFSAILALLLLAVPAAAGISLPFESIASDVLGISCGVGVLGFFLADYGPRKTPDYRAVRAPEPRRNAVPAPSAWRSIPLPNAVSFDGMSTVNLVVPMEMRDDPATASLV